MRSVFGRVALLLGAFALAASAIAFVWGHDAAHRIPLDVDSVTQLTGTASGALAKSDTPVPVVYTNHTLADSHASTGDVFAAQQVSCMATSAEPCIDDNGDFVLDASDPSIVTIGTNKFALDRRTSMPVEDQAKYVKDSAEVAPYDGVVIKFPFDTEKKDYPYWDGTLGKAVTATYEGTKKIDGLETYEFHVVVPKTDAEIAEGTQGTYQAEQTIWVDPTTGSFIDQTGSQTVALPDGTLLLDADVRYTAETVKKNVDTAKSNTSSLRLVDVVARFGGLVLGVILIALGVFLLRRRATPEPAPKPAARMSKV
ncbi:DUF3068 domain-containing protein [Nocardioides sp. Kera G14]|uniref:DUF3068 domain-containing protein n=1 Tax=Nocardioides sp. Kera G14 TaxID=2884264 RepID=UPI001D11B1E5|nr:DUF3068 domain-containing protein [Nocardioides sp. Kera G14]UDY22421.1 DUF3068 domain-containing protein [Nocardioides sp. Kera G14]